MTRHGRSAALARGLALGALVVAFLAVPAGAHEPSVQIALEELDGQGVSGTVTEPRELVIHGQATHDGVPPVERVELSLSAPDLPDGCAVPTYEPVPAGEASDFRRPLLALNCNGTWTVAATAVTPTDPASGHGNTRGVGTTTLLLAVPPADPQDVTASAVGEDGEENRRVTLTWAPNTETDLTGYRIERAAPDESFKLLVTVGTEAEPSFTDDELAQGGEHRYRVYAQRRGLTSARSDRVTSVGFGSASASVAQPPATTSTTTIDGETTTTSAPGTAITSRPRPRPAPARPRPRTTIDSGFDESLPFDPSQTTTTAEGALEEDGQEEPPDDDAVVALRDVGSDGDETGSLLVPVAGSLAMLVVAAHVRHLVRRASEDEDVITPL